jgi:transposase
MIQSTKLTSYNIKKIMKCFCIDIDATKTAKLIGINRNTINRFYIIFRRAIYYDRITHITKIIGATVEFDESYFGARRKRGFHGKLKRGRGTQKKPVFGIFKRNGEVYTEMIPDCKKKTLIPIIQGKVDVSCIVNADGWRSYDGLVDVGYDKVFRVNHSANQFALKGQDGATITVNGIESFWSFTKRRLSKFNGYSVNFDLHLKECEWRWSKSQTQLIDQLTKIVHNYNIKFLRKIKTELSGC